MVETTGGDEKTSTQRRRDLIALIFLVLIALVPRIYRLDAGGLSEDESHKVQAARSYRAGDLTANAEHPMLMKVLITMALVAAERWNHAVALRHPGFAVSEETAVRLPNAVFGALTTAVLFFFTCRRFNPTIGWLTAILWATGINAISFNRIAKEDTLLVFFIWLGFYFYLKAKQQGPVETARRDRLYMLSGASFGLMLASKYFPHYMGLNFLYYYLCPHDRQTNYPLGRKTVVKFFAAFFLAFVLANPMLFHPHTLQYLEAYTTEKTLTHHGYEMMDHLYYNNVSKLKNATPVYFYLLYFLVKTPPILLLALLIGLIVTLRGSLTNVCGSPNKDGVTFLRFMLIFWIVPYSLFGGKWLRYTLSAMPMVYMMAAIGILAVYRKPMTWRWPAPVRLTAATVTLVALLVAPTLAVWRSTPYCLLYVNFLGGGTHRRAYYFPPDEVYDAGTREALQFIAQRAPSKSVVAQDTPGIVDVYSRKFKRTDLLSVQLSSHDTDLGRIPPGDPVYVIVQKGQKYFENRDRIDRIERHHKPIKEIWVDGVLTTKVYEIE